MPTVTRLSNVPIQSMKSPRIVSSCVGFFLGRTRDLRRWTARDICEFDFSLITAPNRETGIASDIQVEHGWHGGALGFQIGRLRRQDRDGWGNGRITGSKFHIGAPYNGSECCPKGIERLRVGIDQDGRCGRLIVLARSERNSGEE